MTSKNGETLDPAEKDKFFEAICPDCGEQKLMEGPHGGLSVNYMCDGCGSKFNHMGVFGVQRISDKGTPKSGPYR